MAFERLNKIFAKKKKYKVMIVDDDPSVLKSYKFYLSKHYEVITASSGLEAIEYVKNNPQDIASVILDVKMNEKDGFQTFLDLRKINYQLLITLHTAFAGDLSEKDMGEILTLYDIENYIRKEGTKQDPVELVREQIERDIQKYQRIKWTEQKVHELGDLLHKGREPEDFVGLYNIIGGELKGPLINDDALLITDATDPKKILGLMPDCAQEEYELAKDNTKKSLDDIANISYDVRKRIIQRAGEIACSGVTQANNVLGYNASDFKALHSKLKELVPRTNICTHKVRDDDFLLNEEWLNDMDKVMMHSYGVNTLEELIEKDNSVKKKTVAISIQNSMVQTGLYGMYQALMGGHSVLLKLDSKDPFSEYIGALAYHAAFQEAKDNGIIDKNAKCNLNVLSWKTKKWKERGADLMEHLDKFVFMGSPINLIYIKYGVELTQEHMEHPEDIASLTRTKWKKYKEILEDPDIVSYTSHMGAGYLHKDLNNEQLDEATDHIVYSMISHYRSCKRMLNLTIHEDIYDRAMALIQHKLSNLNVGTTTEPDADMVRVSDEMWSHVEKYVGHAQKYGKVSHLGKESEKMNPIITEMYDDSLASDGIDNLLSQENMFGYMNIFKGNEDTAVEVTRKMGKHLRGPILEFATYTNDQRIVEHMTHNLYAHGKHVNEPTTWGLKYNRGHEDRTLIEELAKDYKKAA